MAIHAIPVYAAAIGGEQLRYVKRAAEDCGVGPAIVRYLGRTKGAADVLGLISRSCRLATPMVSGVASDWTLKVGSLAGTARAGLSIPYAITLGAKLHKKFETRNAVELGSTSLFSASSMVLSRSLSASLSSWGAILKTAVDGMDLDTSVRKYSRVTALAEKSRGIAGVPAEVVAGLEAENLEQTLRVGRFSTAVFSGTVVAVSYLAQVAFSKTILLAALVSSVASIIFSIGAEMVHETAMYPKAPKIVVEAPLAHEPHFVEREVARLDQANL